LILAIVIFLLSPLSPFRFLTDLTQQLFSFPKALIYGIKGQSGNDSSQVTSLKKENKRLTEKLIDYEKIKKDNIAFRSQFEDNQEKHYKLLPASVIGFTGRFSSPVTLIIDQGENEGIKSGMAVILDNNLVGKIKKVGPSYSEIVLPTDPSFSTVGITSESNAAGVVVGQNDFVLFDRVATSSKMTIGETVLSKGAVDNNGYGIPPGIVIGKIASVSHNAALAFQTAKIESLVNFSRITKVFIILGV
jgi:rod shape-determining protein MreC